MRIPAYARSLPDLMISQTMRSVCETIVQGLESPKSERWNELAELDRWHYKHEGDARLVLVQGLRQTANNSKSPIIREVALALCAQLLGEDANPSLADLEQEFS